MEKEVLEKIVNVIKDKDYEFEICWIEKGIFGMIDGNRITINVFDSIIITLLHECLHAVYPLATEQQIESASWKVFRTLTPRRRRYLIKIFEKRLAEANNG